MPDSPSLPVPQLSPTKAKNMSVKVEVDDPVGAAKAAFVACRGLATQAIQTLSTLRADTSTDKNLLKEAVKYAADTQADADAAKANFLAAVETQELLFPSGGKSSLAHAEHAHKSKSTLESVVLKQLPRFEAATGVHVYVDAVDDVLDIVGVREDSEKIKLLALKLGGTMRRWCVRNLVTSDPPLTWSQAKEKFLENYSALDVEEKNLSELVSTHQRAGESVASFRDRVCELAERGGADLEDEFVDRLVATQFHGHLRANIQTWVRVLVGSGRMPSTLHAMAELARRAEQIVSNLPTGPFAGRAAGKNSETGSRPVVTCYGCGKEGHKRDACPNRATARAGGPGGEKKSFTTASAGTSSKGERKCFGCGQTGHLRANCPAQQPAVRAVRTGEAEAASASVSESESDDTHQLLGYSSENDEAPAVRMVRVEKDVSQFPLDGLARDPYFALGLLDDKGDSISLMCQNDPELRIRAEAFKVALETSLKRKGVSTAAVGKAPGSTGTKRAKLTVVTQGEKAALEEAVSSALAPVNPRSALGDKEADKHARRMAALADALRSKEEKDKRAKAKEVHEAKMWDLFVQAVSLGYRGTREQHLRLTVSERVALHKGLKELQDKERRAAAEQIALGLLVSPPPTNPVAGGSSEGPAAGSVPKVSAVVVANASAGGSKADVAAQRVAAEKVTPVKTRPLAARKESQVAMGAGAAVATKAQPAANDDDTEMTDKLDVESSTSGSDSDSSESSGDSGTEDDDDRDAVRARNTEKGGGAGENKVAVEYVCDAGVHGLALPKAREPVFSTEAGVGFVPNCVPVFLSSSSHTKSVFEGVVCASVAPTRLSSVEEVRAEHRALRKRWGEVLPVVDLQMIVHAYAAMPMLPFPRLSNFHFKQVPDDPPPVRAVQTPVTNDAEEKKEESAPDEQKGALFAPCSFNGVALRALLDSGSVLSAVSRREAEKHGWTINPPSHGSGFLRLANGSRTPRLGSVIGDLRWGLVARRARFEVMDLEEDMIVGTDMMFELGVRMDGIPTSMPPEDDEAKSAEEGPAGDFDVDHVDPEELSSANAYTSTLWLDEDRCSEEVVQTVLEGVEGTLAKNDAIPLGEFCSHPAAVVSFNLRPGMEAPVFRRQYPLPHSVWDKVTEKVLLWKARGTIVPAPPGCPWNNPLLAVKKKDAQGNLTDVRVCIDPRAVNEKLLDYSFVVPRVGDLYARLEKFKIASALDLHESYHQFPIQEEHRPYTTFTWQGERYMFAGAPFGFSPLTQQFQAVMETVLAPHRAYVVVFIDDIVVFSRCAEDHVRHLSAVIETLTRWNLKLKTTKCKVGYNRLRVLGHILEGDKRVADPRKLSALVEWKRPTSGKQIEAFLGFVNYLRDYVPLYASLAAPLEQLRKLKTIGKEWTDECEASFRGFCAVLSRSPAIEPPKWDSPFIVSTDASQRGVGAVLFQHYDDRDHFVCFASKALNKGQRNYSATRRELLAIVFALQRFREYVYGTHFELRTDHKALTFMFTQKHVNYMLLNWLDVLLDYDFSIVHSPGVLLVLPDALSRYYPDFVWEERGVAPSVRTVSTASLKPSDEGSREEKKHASISDGEKLEGEKPAKPDMASGGVPTSSGTNGAEQEGRVVGVKVEPSDEEEPKTTLKLSELADYPNKELVSLINERFDRTMPTEEKRRELVTASHLEGHFGAEYLYRKLWHQGYYWPSMKQDCLHAVDTCGRCLRYNVGRQGFNPLRSITASFPMDQVAIDLMAMRDTSPRGHNYVLVVVCICTRFCWLRALQSKSAEDVARALWGIFCDFGPPKVIQSDNGSEFVNSLVRAMTKLMGVDHRLVAPYNPRANGSAERYVALAKTSLKKMAGGNLTNFDLFLPAVQRSLNLRSSARTNSTPMALMFARPNNPLEDYAGAPAGPLMTEEEVAARNAEMVGVLHPELAAVTQEVQKAKGAAADKRRPKAKHIPVGSTVMIQDVVRSSKLDPYWLGPYTVAKISANKTFSLLDSSGHLLGRVVPVHQLKLVALPDAVSVEVKSSEDGDFSARVTYQVEAITRHRGPEGAREYLTKWVGYSEAESTWEPASHFEDDSLIRAYWKGNPVEATSSSSKSERSKVKKLKGGKAPPKPKSKSKK